MARPQATLRCMVLSCQVLLDAGERDAAAVLYAVIGEMFGEEARREAMARLRTELAAATLVDMAGQ